MAAIAKPCHDETGWKPAHFTAADHARTALSAARKTCGCSVRQVPPAERQGDRISRALRRLYRVPSGPAQGPVRRHAAQQPLRGLPRCRGLEAGDLTRWPRTTRPRFALKGAHAAVPCSGCHASPRGDDTPYHPAAANCTDCHQNPHGQLAMATRCEACHSVASWKERGRFDHNQTAFTLLGVTPPWIAWPATSLRSNRTASATSPSTAPPRIAPAATPTSMAASFMPRRRRKRMRPVPHRSHLAAHGIRPQPPFHVQTRRRARAGSLPDVPRPASRQWMDVRLWSTKERRGSANNAISESRDVVALSLLLPARSAQPAQTGRATRTVRFRSPARPATRPPRGSRIRPHPEFNHNTQTAYPLRGMHDGRAVPGDATSTRFSARPRTIAPPAMPTCIARRWGSAASSATRCGAGRPPRRGRRAITPTASLCWARTPPRPARAATRARPTAFSWA